MLVGFVAPDLAAPSVASLGSASQLYPVRLRIVCIATAVVPFPKLTDTGAFTCNIPLQCSSNTTMRGEIFPPLLGRLRIHRRKERLTGVRVPAVNRTLGGIPPERKRVKTSMDIGDEGFLRKYHQTAVASTPEIAPKKHGFHTTGLDGIGPNIVDFIGCFERRPDGLGRHKTGSWWAVRDSNPRLPACKASVQSAFSC